MNLFNVKFNASPKITRLNLATGQPVIVIDDILDEPGKMVALAASVGAEFVPALGSPFPGSQLLMDNGFSAKLDDFFRLHVREILGGRRSLHMYSRLSRVTTPSQDLDARQRICHRDNADVEVKNMIAASVLYLFEDPNLGGTVFFRHIGSLAETELLVHDASHLSPLEFEAKYDWPASYPTQSNRYFEVIGRVAAKWNRIIFYDGSIFHSSDISNPQLLTAPQHMGRLSINGFFTCTRKAV